MTFSCGCSPESYCPTHLHWYCHGPSPEQERSTFVFEMGGCPRCKSERWASVNIDGRATPTRRGAGR